MTLQTRIVGALVVAALVPMAVVIAVPLAQSRKRADEETAHRRDRALKLAAVLLNDERRSLATEADRAARELGAEPEDLAALVRGPEAIAKPVAVRLAERHGFTAVSILGDADVTLAEAGTVETLVLIERRPVKTEHETLTLVVSRSLGDDFAAKAGELADAGARFAATCTGDEVAVPIDRGHALCLTVVPADAKSLRRDLLGSFAGVASIAVILALLVGALLASRIASPIRRLAVRAEKISEERSRPITLLPEQDETRRLTLAFDQMLDALSASERQRLAAERAAAWEEIARRLAHEIKNPLSPIQLAVENLRRVREKSPETFDRALEEETATILEEVGALKTLVDEFAQFARLPQPRIGPCDPKAVLEQTLVLFSGRIESMGVHLSVQADDAPKTIHADVEQLGRVFKNVVANALDAMERSSRRELAVAMRRTGSDLAIEFRDTGSGFDAEALRRVFEPYFTTRGDHGGTGLGMAIAYRIVTDHGGTIRAEGAPGRGAAITILLPADRA
ncbi:MAG TPA: ATP-binding protein [Candidatus Polarisedimenticolaceae bacterium]|nr:ATP-binding protein [Candidatus Polarisedimenticolaceae bacterium]